jgi:hypothetical protein
VIEAMTKTVEKELRQRCPTLQCRIAISGCPRDDEDLMATWGITTTRMLASSCSTDEYHFQIVVFIEDSLACLIAGDCAILLRSLDQGGGFGSGHGSSRRRSRAPRFTGGPLSITEWPE